MTKLPTITEEAQRIAGENGYYVPIWQLNDIIKLSSKITNMIATSKAGVTYSEAMLAIKIVERSLALGHSEQTGE